MLQQILDDMWIDPELLAELDEPQKQTLFCKMREEQVRRWKLWESQTSLDTGLRKSVSDKKVDWMLGEDGEPWVWVMGEHPDDKSIDQILEAEAREAAQRLAEKDAQNARLRLSEVEAELTELLELNKRQMEEIESAKELLDHEEIYCSADELRLPQTSINPKRDALQEISFNKPQAKVSQRVAQWEKRLMEERATEHFKRIQRKKLEAAKEAEEAENKQEQFWKEQQRKSKEAEQQMRDIARRAREEHRRSIVELENPLQGSLSLECTKEKNAFPKPPNKDAIVEWFRSSQAVKRAGLESNTNSIAPWFHGLITRQEAESLLLSQPTGSFLVRVSERIWGYAISYKDADRCKHYLIDASNGTYQFLGNNQKIHSTLGDLIKYHGLKPITADGGELLGKPCHRNKPLPPAFQPFTIRVR